MRSVSPERQFIFISGKEKNNQFVYIKDRPKRRLKSDLQTLLPLQLINFLFLIKKGAQIGQWTSPPEIKQTAHKIMIKKRKLK